MNAEQIKTAKTAELVAFYNAHADKKVSKFQDRATAERRVAELVASLADVAPVKAAIGSTDQSGNDVHDFGARTKVGKTVNNSAAVAKSWELDAVRAARSTRDAVAVTEDAEDRRVNHGLYKSVSKAFVALGLPMNKHVKFRAELKKNGTAQINGFTFRLATV